MVGPHADMTRAQSALMHAGNIKAGLYSRSEAVHSQQSRHGLSFMDALLDVDIAIGAWNEGKRFSDVPALSYV